MAITKQVFSVRLYFKSSQFWLGWGGRVKSPYGGFSEANFKLMGSENSLVSVCYGPLQVTNKLAS